MRHASFFALFAAGSVAIGACSLGLDENAIVETGSSGSAGGGGSSDGGGGGSTVTSGSTTGAGGAGAGADCWDMDATDASTWTVTAVATANLEGVDPSSLRISADGLALAWIAGIDLGGTILRRPHRMTRTNRSAPFAGGALLAAFANLAADVDHPAFSQGDDELIVNNGTDLFVSVNSVNSYSDPAPMSSLNSLLTEALSTLTSDGSRVMFQRGDAPGSWRIHEAARLDPPTPGGAFAAPTQITVPLLGAGDISICPVLSPDGLTLLFSSNYPDDPAIVDPASITKVWITRRPTVDEPWGLPKHVTAFDSDTIQTCPASVTADGCEVYFDHFDASVPTPPVYFVAKRQAPP